MDEKPTNCSEMAQMVWPDPVCRLRGGYAVQPLSAPPTTKLIISRMAPGGSSQNDRAFSLGNAMSSAPSCNGMT